MIHSLRDCCEALREGNGNNADGSALLDERRIHGAKWEVRVVTEAHARYFVYHAALGGSNCKGHNSSWSKGGVLQEGEMHGDQSRNCIW